MIEIIRELGSVLKDLPDMAVYIMAGILFYKVVIVGGTISLIKYAINKTHSLLTKISENKTKPKQVIKKYDIDGKFIKSDGALALFHQMLDEIHTGCGFGSQYIHKSDVLYVMEALREKREREKQSEQPRGNR